MHQAHCGSCAQEACPNSPWSLTFSYGRALQSATLKVQPVKLPAEMLLACSLLPGRRMLHEQALGGAAV